MLGQSEIRQAGKIIKYGGTSNQILLANGDTIDKDKFDYEPIENATQQVVAIGIATPRNIPLNAVIFATKQQNNPPSYAGAVVIDCSIWEAAIKYACESKICR
ncbi:MAG: hypothetical protein EZS28_003618 [Streblomastix strix]|uniref:Uncharacterized protein n=1 Tax=Streblomastix strix TaxID=222440 RepID=A0A5J4X314_9EUKA|nr:MAG: hypothetical protein EZS28_003618 [Streblomastix strix]